MQYHYENTPMYYTAIFRDSKNEKFQMKDCNIFSYFCSNIDRGYSLEPPH